MHELADVASAVDALTNPIRHTERIYERDLHRNKKLTRVWTVTLPSMIDQLDMAKFPGETYTEDNPHGNRGKRIAPAPPARLEAINASLRIQAGAAVWCTRFDLALRATTADNLRALVGARTDSEQTNQLLADLRRWYGNAATLAGWIRPAWAPQAPCPLCGERAIRVRLDKETASCISCGEGWTPESIGILAAHITAHATRTERDTTHLREAAVLARRQAEATRIGTERRPDLPYVNTG